MVQQREKKSFSAYINDNKVKNAIVERLGGDVQAASRLISTITAAVNGNEKLKEECDYNTIVSAALTGEVGMNLSYALGQYAIIPYGKEAKYQLQVNGLKQLCIRSKAYSKINVYDVREGEFVGRDPLTREPIFKWIEDEDVRLSLPICGYYAFYMLNSANNNFFQCLYWSHEKILQHADRYAPGFDLAKYRALLAGELTPEEVAKLQGTKQKKGSSPWYANPNDDPHIKMCMKTVLKQLLNDGLAPKSIQEVIIEDDETDAQMSAGDGDGAESGETSYSVIESTGEVVDGAEGEKTACDGDSCTVVLPEEKAPEKPKRGRKPAAEEKPERVIGATPEDEGNSAAFESMDDDALASFFGA